MRIPTRLRFTTPGLSLLEAMLATVILVLAIVPTVSLMTTSAKEVVKVQERLLATHLAMSLIENMRSRRPADRVELGGAKPADLPHLRPLIAAFKASKPTAGPTLDAMLANFACRVTLPGPPAKPTVRVEVTYGEGGQTRSVALESRLDTQ